MKKYTGQTSMLNGSAFSEKNTVSFARRSMKPALRTVRTLKGEAMRRSSRRPYK